MTAMRQEVAGFPGHSSLSMLDLESGDGDTVRRCCVKKYETPGTVYLCCCAYILTYMKRRELNVKTENQN